MDRCSFASKCTLVRRAALLLVCALVLPALLATPAFAASTAVTQMHMDCAVEPDGACVVTMELTVSFAPGTQGFSIPISPLAREVVCTGAPYQLSAEEDCKLIRLTGSFSGQKKLSVRYRLAETVRVNGNTQEFELRLLYPYWTCPISGYELNLHLPGKFESMPEFTSGYYRDLIDNYLNIQVSEGLVYAALNDQQTLQDSETLSVKLTLPNGFFDLRFLAGKTTSVDRMLFFGLLILSGLYWFVFLRSLSPLPKRQAMPPEGGTPGEIPFILTRRNPDFAMMVVQWASLGYLTIFRSRKGRLSLIRQIDMGNERKRYEGELFQTLFSRGDQCDVESAEYIKARQLAVEKARKFWNDRIFDPKAGSPTLLRLLVLSAGAVLCFACFDLLVASKSWRWFVILPMTLVGGAACRIVQSLGGMFLRRHKLRTGCFAALALAALVDLGSSAGLLGLMLLNLSVQLAVGFLLRCGGRRTKSGFVLGSELLGYRRYLLGASAALVRSNLEADPQFFYRVLPYAEALQVGRRFANSFDRTRLEECDWLRWEGRELCTAPAFYARYLRLMAGLRGERDPAAKRSAKRDRAAVSTRVVQTASHRADRADSASAMRSSRREGRKQ